jgi:hypothetical protein
MVSNYFRCPIRMSERMQRVLIPTVRFSIDAEWLVVTTPKAQAKLEWARVKSVLDRKPYFLLVLSPFAFIVVPKASLPAEIAALLLGRVTKRFS